VETASFVRGFIGTVFGTATLYWRLSRPSFLG